MKSITLQLFISALVSYGATFTFTSGVDESDPGKIISWDYVSSSGITGILTAELLGGNAFTIINDGTTASASWEGNGTLDWSFSGGEIPSGGVTGFMMLGLGDHELTLSGAPIVTHNDGFIVDADTNALLSVGDSLEGITIQNTGSIPFGDLRFNSWDLGQMTALNAVVGNSLSTNGLSITFEAIPEPSVSLLGGLVGLALIGKRKR